MTASSLQSRQRGQAIVLIALMLTVITGMAAIAIDGARAYALRRDLQAAVDSAALTAADRLQQSGSYVSAEQAATSNFGSNLRLYTAPSCTAYGTPGASSWTVTCTYPDNTVLTQVVQALGPQGSQFSLTATRPLQLQFARILTNGTIPTVAAASVSDVNNQRYTPAVAALAQDGCGGTGGTSVRINGTGTLSVKGAVLANGSITDAAGALRVAGDIYARCQPTVPGPVTNACYPSGATAPCLYPDVAGATRSGFHLVDPGYPAPSNLGGGQGLPSSVVIAPGIYSTPLLFTGGHCWFLSGGVYTFQGGTVNTGDFVSNELKPPSEPSVSNNAVPATNQFWNTDGVNCQGGFQLVKQSGPRDIPLGIWSFVLTSTRTDLYNGTSYFRESAPSVCEQINLNNHFDNVDLEVSNVPGATAYNIYAAPPGNGCGGPFGLAATLPVTGPVTNTNTNPCPIYTGLGCTLGNEDLLLSTQLSSPFTPNAAAAPGTAGAYPPDPETAPLAIGLPNENPPEGSGATGDRANENNCQSIGGVYVGCPNAITPGAVELNYPTGSCLFAGNGGDMFLFSGNQYNWLSVYQPPANACTNTLGAAANSAFVGLVYMPAATVDITSAYTFEAPGVGGVMASSFVFSGTLPTITFSPVYAPVPPASRLTG